jgi:hypothetical protein
LLYIFPVIPLNPILSVIKTWFYGGLVRKEVYWVRGIEPIEAFIAIATLRSGFSFGVYDLVGVAFGLLALALIGRHPVLASLLWLGTLPLLYSGRLLVSVACLPVLLLPLLAAGLALWSWHLSRQAN